MTWLIAIDWGTTSFRAYRISEHGQVLDKRQSASGILAVNEGRFSETLISQISDWLDMDPGAHVVMSGMIESRQGWQEVDYVTGTPGLAEITAGIGKTRLDNGRNVWIVPGCSCLNADGQPDVMRGEETQVMGAVSGDGGLQIFCLPGTHSKWVSVDNGRISGFTTFMTGEVYDVLCQHSILGKLMTDAGRNEGDAAIWFDDGVRKAKSGISLLSGFFGVRARALFSEIPECYTKDYLSGLLIGTEIRDAYSNQDTEVTLIGSGHLMGLYSRAIQAFGGAAVLADEDLAAVGLYRIANQMKADRLI